MSRRDDVLSRHSGVIRQAAARHKADSIALVGSVARGDDGDDSDYGFVAARDRGASLFGLAGLQLDLRSSWGATWTWSQSARSRSGTKACSTTPSRCDRPCRRLTARILDAAGKPAEIEELVRGCAGRGRGSLRPDWVGEPTNCLNSRGATLIL